MTIRLYHNNDLVHEQDVCAEISKRDGKTHYAVNQSFVMEDIKTPAVVNYATVAPLGVPHEADISWGTTRLGKGHTLTLQGSPKGMLVIT